MERVGNRLRKVSLSLAIWRIGISLQLESVSNAFVLCRTCENQWIHHLSLCRVKRGVVRFSSQVLCVFATLPIFLSRLPLEYHQTFVNFLIGVNYKIALDCITCKSTAKITFPFNKIDQKLRIAFIFANCAEIVKRSVWFFVYNFCDSALLLLTISFATHYFISAMMHYIGSQELWCNEKLAWLS